MNRLIFSCVLSCSLLVACGDDDVTVDAALDAVVQDAVITPDQTVVPDASGDGAVVPDATPPTDGGTGMCPPGVCDLIANGCAAGQGCYWLEPSGGGTPAPTCAEAGTAAEGEACTTYSDCQEGHTCSEGSCSKYCCGGSDVGCPNGRTCSIALQGSNSQAGLCVAPDNCDILAQTGCEDMEGCYPNSDATSVCALAGSNALNTMCEFNNDCPSGATCVGTAQLPSECRAFCDPSNSDCPQDFNCAGLTGLEGIGVCVPASS